MIEFLAPVLVVGVIVAQWAFVAGLCAALSAAKSALGGDGETAPERALDGGRGLDF